MTQTWAILLDAYRELNARKMFWITLILSGLVVAGFALLGVSDKGLTILGARLPVPMPQYMYKKAFSLFVIGFWVKWGAIILALVSTASIYPELLSSGSIDLYLSKPIGRLRLFLTKYLGGLLFVILQTLVFAIGSFLVFGFRVHQWRPALFLIVPLVVLLFSYLFCVCTLVGVLTRSTIAAVLLTVLFWFVCFGINLAEYGLFLAKTTATAQVHADEQQVRRANDELAGIKADPSFLNAFGIRERHIRQRRDQAQADGEEARQTAAKLRTYHTIAYGVASVIPKTGETVDLLDRLLFTDADLAETSEDRRNRNMFANGFEQDSETTHPATTEPAQQQAEAAADARDRQDRVLAAREEAQEVQHAARTRSIPWILGTSLGFELLILTWAAWIFHRRDY